ncbi:hypothetical protein G9A89_014102 [Geosiphon pyriformis]|nr:hypothetical protein G9A89_014102 [Geosiphon pyriformis]
MTISIKCACGLEDSDTNNTLSLLIFMTMTRAKSKKVANITFPIVTNKVLTRKSLSVIEAVRQNILATFSLKNISKKLSLAASGSFSSPLAGGSSPVKVSFKRHTQVSPNVVSIIFKSPKNFNNRPVNKLVFSALTTTTTTITFTLQITTKAKNSRNHPLPNMNSNNNGSTPNMKQDQPLAVFSNVVISDRSSSMEIELSTSPPVSGVADGSAWLNVNVASIFVSGIIFKIKIALLILQNAVKLFCVEFASQESLTGATKVAIGNKIFLITLKIAWSFDVVSVFSPPLSVALCNIPLDNFSDDIKSALGVFGVVISTLLLLLLLLFTDLCWLGKTAKLVNLPFGCTAFEITAVSGGKLLDVVTATNISPPFSPKFFFNFAGGFKIFKLSFTETKFYAKAAVYVVLLVAAAIDMDLGFGVFLIGIISLLPVVLFGSDVAVNAKLASLKSHLSELSLLIKFLVESVDALVVLVTKLLSALSVVDVSVKESVAGLAKQNKGFATITSII